MPMHTRLSCPATQLSQPSCSKGLCLPVSQKSAAKGCDVSQKSAVSQKAVMFLVKIGEHAAQWFKDDMISKCKFLSL